MHSEVCGADRILLIHALSTPAQQAKAPKKHAIIYGDKDEKLTLKDSAMVPATSPAEKKEQKRVGGRRRLIIVAKQLPVKCTRNDKGEWKVEWDDARSFLSNLRVLQSGMDVKVRGNAQSPFVQLVHVACAA